MPTPSVSIIILNTNRRKDTLECLASLLESTYENFSIMVLDNQSTDGSIKAIRSEYPQVEIVRLEKNLGYAGNNNVGIEIAQNRGFDWIFVLNEDTILAPDCIERLVKVGESDPKIGILGPMVYHFDEPDVIQSAGGVLNHFWLASHTGQNEADRGQFPDPRPVDWISGCAILIRKAVVDQIGALDERFFYYWEETEWCIRARKAGWNITHVPGAKLWHKGVQRNYRPGPSVTYYSTRNWLLLLSKHHAPIRAWVGVWFWTIRTLLSWTIKPKWRSKREHRDAMWYATMDFMMKRWGKMPERKKQAASS